MKHGKTATLINRGNRLNGGSLELPAACPAKLAAEWTGRGFSTEVINLSLSIGLVKHLTNAGGKED